MATTQGVEGGQSRAAVPLPCHPSLGSVEREQLHGTPGWVCAAERGSFLAESPDGGNCAAPAKTASPRGPWKHLASLFLGPSAAGSIQRPVLELPCGPSNGTRW